VAALGIEVPPEFIAFNNTTLSDSNITGRINNAPMSEFTDDIFILTTVDKLLYTAAVS
jgi:hypothetical protein